MYSQKIINASSILDSGAITAGILVSYANPVGSSFFFRANSSCKFSAIVPASQVSYASLPLLVPSLRPAFPFLLVIFLSLPSWLVRLCSLLVSFLLAARFLITTASANGSHVALFIPSQRSTLLPGWFPAFAFISNLYARFLHFPGRIILLFEPPAPLFCSLVFCFATGSHFILLYRTLGLRDERYHFHALFPAWEIFNNCEYSLEG